MKQLAKHCFFPFSATVRNITAIRISFEQENQLDWPETLNKNVTKVSCKQEICSFSVFPLLLLSNIFITVSIKNFCIRNITSKANAASKVIF